MYYFCGILRHFLYCVLIIFIAPSSPLNLTKEGATTVSSGYSSSHPLMNAIDDKPSSCSSLTSGKGSKTWLQVYVQTLWYIKEVRLLFNGNTSNAKLLIGRSLATNGLLGNTKSRPLSNSGSGLHWENVTCYQPILGQVIYIESMSTSMQICHIEVLYGQMINFSSLSIEFKFSIIIDKALNIYNPVSITASSQNHAGGPVWAPLDGIKSSTTDLTWISVSSRRPWWRMEFSVRRAISSVVILPKSLSNSERARMNGFAVYIGDSPIGNGSGNAICGKPWAAVDTSVIIMNCFVNMFGKYLYVAGADVSNAVLYLSEISVYECQGFCSSVLLGCV